jgi:hypothetical protein
MLGAIGNVLLKANFWQLYNDLGEGAIGSESQDLI